MHSLSKDLSLSAVIAGLIAVIISYAGPLIIVFQAAREAHLPATRCHRGSGPSPSAAASPACC